MDGKEVYQLTETLKCPFYGGLCVCACVCWISRDILVFHLELRFPFIGLLLGNCPLEMVLRRGIVLLDGFSFVHSRCSKQEGCLWTVFLLHIGDALKKRSIAFGLYVFCRVHIVLRGILLLDCQFLDTFKYIIISFSKYGGYDMFEGC